LAFEEADEDWEEGILDLHAKALQPNWNKNQPAHHQLYSRYYVRVFLTSAHGSVFGARCIEYRLDKAEDQA
jgi:hypothetical protein